MDWKSISQLYAMVLCLDLLMLAPGSARCFYIFVFLSFCNYVSPHLVPPVPGSAKPSFLSFPANKKQVEQIFQSYKCNSSGILIHWGFETTIDSHHCPLVSEWIFQFLDSWCMYCLLLVHNIYNLSRRKIQIFHHH